jgi:hypothetical protein
MGRDWNVAAICCHCNLAQCVYNCFDSIMCEVRSAEKISRWRSTVFSALAPGQNLADVAYSWREG